VNSPLESAVLFQIGPVPITPAVVTTWVIMLVLILGAYFLTRRIGMVPSKRQAALELIVATLDTQIGETTGAAPGPYRSFIGTLFLYILVAIMIPLNLVEQITRTFSLMVRLFGNVMSGVFVVGIVLSLAGLLVPIPLMALDLLTGLVQAYIFAVLATVFIGAALGAKQGAGAPPKPKEAN
jgi:F-type H+-transporting ATPase subunit a